MNTPPAFMTASMDATYSMLLSKHIATITSRPTPAPCNVAAIRSTCADSSPKVISRPPCDTAMFAGCVAATCPNTDTGILLSTVGEDATSGTNLELLAYSPHGLREGLTHGLFVGSLLHIAHGPEGR